MKISVVGSLNMDMTVTAPRIPGKGETILGHELHFNSGGKGANQAYALGRLGADVAMFGCVGQDDFGRQLIDNLKHVGVNTDFIRIDKQTKTGVALITGSVVCQYGRGYEHGKIRRSGRYADKGRGSSQVGRQSLVLAAIRYYRKKPTHRIQG